MVRLQDQPTRLLMKWLEYSRSGGYWHPAPFWQEFTTDDIKEELATREHIPNKKEAKEIRRRRAKQGRPGRKDK